ncbi:MAG TPA: FG-GAP repeat protein, partial [Planctomycetota bacterium]|nr:FG-GAP repeat protein [Planctomycetota bacterium]
GRAPRPPPFLGGRLCAQIVAAPVDAASSLPPPPMLACLTLASLLAAPGVAFAAQGDPLVFTASDAANIDHFGRTLSVSGETLVVGSRYATHGGLSIAGAAYVFEQHGLNWIERAKLVAPDADVQDLFGHAVAVSGDTALISARNDDHGGVVDAGSAYVFVRGAEGWDLQAKLTAPDAGEFDAFGISVGLSGDVAVIGAALDDTGFGVDAGSAYVFAREGTTWSLQAKLTASDALAQDLFGSAVAVSGDTVLVGSPRDDHAGGFDAGALYVFERVGAAWSQNAKLVAVDAQPGDQLGGAIATSGATLAVGARFDDHSGAVDAGSVYVFVHDGSAWSLQARLVDADAGAGDGFGSSVAVEGERIVAGAPQDDLSGVQNAGSAVLFERSGAIWTELEKLVSPDPEPIDNYATAVALADVAALVGAPHEDLFGALDVGSVYVSPFDGDCDGSGVPDVDELVLGTSSDCNANWIPDDCDVAGGASLDLDAEGTPDECQPLSASGSAISIAAGGSVALVLDAGPSHAGEFFLVLGSASGTVPGIPVDGQVLPLNLDAYLLLTLQGGGPIVGGFGLLDAEGRAGAAVSLPPAALSPTFAGTEVHHAYVAVHPAFAVVTLTSNAMPIVFVP